MQVRDRSTLYIKQLTGDGTGTDIIMHKFEVPLLNLEKALNEYLAGPMDTDFSLDAVDREVEEPVVPACAAPASLLCMLCMLCMGCDQRLSCSAASRKRLRGWLTQCPLVLGATHDRLIYL